MSKRDMSLGGMQVSSPNWAGDYFDRDALMPGGGRVDATAFTAFPGPVSVRAGAAGTAAAAVPKAGNTGNGVVATVPRTGTRTEVLTITMTDATHFTVVGSVSGAAPGVGVAGAPFLIPGVANITVTAGGVAFIAGDSFTVALTVAAAPAGAIGAVVLPVAALSAALPAGTVLNFGVIGKFAVLALNAAAAAESVTTMPLDQVINAGDTAIFPGSPNVEIPSGTFVSRTFAQRNAGVGLHPAIDGEDEYFLVAFSVVNASVNDEVELVRPFGVIVKENFLPGWQGLSGALQARVRATYKTTLGAE